MVVVDFGASAYSRLAPDLQPPVGFLLPVTAETALTLGRNGKPPRGAPRRTP